MPPVFVLPIILSENYQAFRRDIGPMLASSFEEWARIFANEVAAARLEGKFVLEKVINYRGFTQYCQKNSFKPDPNHLHVLQRDKNHWERYR
jgi:hypothetical protein